MNHSESWGKNKSIIAIFAVLKVASGRSIELIFLTDDPFKGVLCFRYKIRIPQILNKTYKDNWFIYAEGPWGLFRSFISRCLNLEISAKEFPDITVRSHHKRAHAHPCPAIYFAIISFTKKPPHTSQYLHMHMIVGNHSLT